MQEAQSINFSWLLRLRWGALAGQVGVIAVADSLLGVHLPLPPLLTIVAIGLASNAAGAVWMRRQPPVREWMIGCLMTLDFVLLTALLHYTGGPFNPFSSVYLVNIALAAVILSAGWTWFLAGFGFACFGSLFLIAMWSGPDPAASWCTARRR